MALARIKTWIAGEILTANDLNGEFNNIVTYVNALSFNSLMADGTVASPALAFANDTDTGFYRIGANVLGFSAGGATQFTASEFFQASRFVFPVKSATQSAAGPAGEAYWQTAESSLHIRGTTLYRIPAITGLQRGDVIVGRNDAGVSGATTFARLGIGEQGVYNVRLFGAVGDNSTDDTAAIQAAITAAKATGGMVWVPAGIYIISRLDFTGISTGLIFAGSGWNNTRFMPKTGTASYGTATGHLFDCTGSLNVTFRDFQVGAFNQTPEPSTCFFLSQIASGASNAFHFDGVYVTGKYTVAALYVYGVPSCDAVNSDFYNYKSGGGTHTVVAFTNSNNYSLTSDFATVATGFQTTADWTFTACELHKFSGAGANLGVLQIDGAKDLRFTGGNITGGASQYISTASQVDRLAFLGTTFETESEVVTPTNLIGIGSTGASDIRFQDCLGLSASFVGGAGAYDGKGAITYVHFGHVSAGGTLAANSSNFLGPVGTEAIEANAHTLVPFDGVLSSLRANAGGSPGAGKRFVIKVMVNGATSSLTTRIEDGGVSASNVTNYVNVNGGDTISFQWNVDAGANVVGGQIAQCGLQPRPQTTY